MTLRLRRDPNRGPVPDPQHRPPIRWGILGTGGMAHVFTEDLLTLPGHQVAAVGSRSLATAAAFADRYRIGRAHDSYQDLAADDRIDVVYVATPQSHHLTTVGLCLAAGRAVLVEKPFAMTAVEAGELAAVAARSRVFVMEAMWMRFNPVIVAALRLVHDGVIGEVRQVSADFGIDVCAEPDHRLWRPELGGGALLDLGVYPVTLAHLLLGEPDHVAASSVLATSGVDAETTIRLGYLTGATASLRCGLLAETPQTARISGTLGSIEIDEPFFRPPGLTLTRRDSAPTRIALPWRGHGYTHQAHPDGASKGRRGFLQACPGHGKPPGRRADTRGMHARLGAARQAENAISRPRSNPVAATPSSGSRSSARHGSSASSGFSTRSMCSVASKDKSDTVTRS